MLQTSISRGPARTQTVLKMHQTLCHHLLKPFVWRSHHRHDDLNCRWLLRSDGACTNQAEPRRRRAGWALFYGLNHQENHSSPLQGFVQKSDRAELQRIVSAYGPDPGQLSQC